MGWASGADLAEEVWKAVRKRMPKEHRQEVARKIVDAFENHDADTLDDEAPALMKTAYPEGRE